MDKKRQASSSLRFIVCYLLIGLHGLLCVLIGLHGVLSSNWSTWFIVSTRFIVCYLLIGLHGLLCAILIGLHGLLCAIF